MSKRRSNCEHDNLEILPGNVIKCQRCGEPLEDEFILQDLCDRGGPVEITVILYQEKPKPLTYRLSDLR